MDIFAEIAQIKLETHFLLQIALRIIPKSVHWTRFGEHPSGLFRKQLLRKPVEAHTLKVPSNTLRSFEPSTYSASFPCGCFRKLKNIVLYLLCRCTNTLHSQNIHWMFCSLRLTTYPRLRLRNSSLDCFFRLRLKVRLLVRQK